MRNFIKISILVFLLSALEKVIANEEGEWGEHCELEESKYNWLFNSSTIKLVQSLTCHNFTTFPKAFTKFEKVEVLVFGQAGRKSLRKRLFNNLNTLTDGVMRKVFENIPNLRSVLLTDCGIQKIENGAFKGGDKLLALKLNENNITNLDLDIFQDVTNLEFLDLSSNPLGGFQNGAQFPKMELKWLNLTNCSLKALEPTLLDNLVDLRSLALQENHIATLEPRFFTNLKNLQLLHLDGNQFTSFDKNNICNLKHLSVFTFHKNPLFCNCDVFNLIDLLRERNIYYENPDCTFKTTAYIQASNQSQNDSRKDSSLCPHSGRMSLKECREPSREFQEGFCWFGKRISGDLALFCMGYRNGLPKTLGGLLNNVSTLWMDFHRTNNLKILKTGELQETGLSFLEDLDLARCHIQIIERGAFRGGEKIKYLELQENLLMNLDAGAFSGLENLKELNLSNNPIHSFKKGSKFPPMLKLREIHLENCKLTTLEKGIFENLKGVRTINLQKNHMKALSDQVFRSVSSYRGCVRLEGNPWVCADLQFKRMVRYLRGRNIHFTGEGTKCTKPFPDCSGFFDDDCEELPQGMEDLGCSGVDDEEDLGSSEEETSEDETETATTSGAFELAPREDSNENETVHESYNIVMIAALCAALSLIFVVICIVVWKYLKRRSSIRGLPLIFKVELVRSNSQDDEETDAQSVTTEVEP